MAVASPPPPRLRRLLLAAVVALRPVEWIKNLFVLAPLLFGGHIARGSAVIEVLLAAAAFCAISSAGYLINDLLDVELDRRHPVKRFRPIAAGELPRAMAIGLAIALTAGAVAIAAAVGADVAGVVLGYGLLTVTYSLLLKHLVILDVMAIAGCFLLRVLGGSLAAGVTASSWLLFCTGMLSLFLGFTKRRQEAVREADGQRPTRMVLEHYSLPFLDQMVPLVTAGALLSYGIYAINSPLVGGRMLATVPVVLYGLFRYLYLIYAREEDRDTAALVTSDPGLIATMVTWVGLVALLLYL